MELPYSESLSKSAFNFDNYERNLVLQEKGLAPPKATKTGTTIVGTVFKVSHLM